MKAQQGYLLALLPLSYATETIVGVYMFHRHGDRTPKILPPASLTDRGYRQVYTSGKYYRSRYIENDSPMKIMGISPNLVNQEQIAASAPLDAVLQNSAQGFLQSLYPPVGAGAKSSETLANGHTVHAPMDGYQLIPVNLVESGSGSESSGWLQDATACANAELSSNEYFYSTPYSKLLDSTQQLYQNLIPTISPVFNKSTASYMNAYTIYDYLNYARIHNASYNLKAETFQQLHALANVHEYNLAYNSSSTIRAIAGKQLAAEIVQFLDETITTQGENKIGIQFGSYGTFFSFFGLAKLPEADPKFYGVCNYASAMSFELYTTQSFKTFPSADQLRIRFLFHNGTTMDSSPPVQYPLFGQKQMSLSWSDFKTEMGKFSVGNTREWCHVCGNTTGTCAPFSGSIQSSSQSSSSSSSGSGLTNVECGVIGAFVTLAVILLIEGLILLVGGLTVVKKSKLQRPRMENGDYGNGKVYES